MKNKKTSPFFLAVSIALVSILAAGLLASPLRLKVSLDLNTAFGAIIRSTTISKYTASTTIVAQNASGYPGTGWVPNPSGSGSTALNKAVCQSASTSKWTWEWFADAFGNGQTNQGGDGECVEGTTSPLGGLVQSGSWNGATLVVTGTQLSTTSTSGSTNTIVDTNANWAPNSLQYSNANITSGQANTCWGIVKSNSSTTITVYGSWLTSAHASCAGTPPTDNPTFTVTNVGYQDNTWISDYTCSGNFPNGIVVAGSYPTSTTTPEALAVTDCYDGKRDLLPTVASRAIVKGTVSTTSTNVITDSNLTTNPVLVNNFMGQEVLITSGIGAGTTGIIESNTTNSFTVGSWSSTAPSVGSGYDIIYIMPYYGDNDTWGEKGPLTPTVLAAWKGTRLPTSMDFFGYCGVKTGNASTAAGDSKYYSSGASALTALGNYGVNVGRGINATSANDNYINLSNTSYEWLSEQYYINSARIAGTSACSFVNTNTVLTSNRFRAVFRP